MPASGTSAGRPSAARAAAGAASPPRFRLVLLLLSGFAVSLCGLARGDGDGTLQVGSCDAVSPAALAGALGPRLGVLVHVEDQVPLEASDCWTIEVLGTGEDVQVVLRAADGRSWSRPVDLAEPTEDAQRVRTVALAAEYLLAAAQAPFEVRGSFPELVTTEPGPESPVTTVAEGGPQVAATAPVRVDAGASPQDEGAATAEAGIAAAGGEGLWVAMELLLGAAADVPAASAGRSWTLVLGARPSIELSWGLWIHAEVAWHHAAESHPIDISLDSLPIRVGVGAAIPAGAWKLRLAFQAVFEPWWSKGETWQSGWRSGGGFLLSGSWQALSWFTLGVDLGVDLLPHAIQLYYNNDPLFSMGSWRWHAVLCLGFGNRFGM